MKKGFMMLAAVLVLLAVTAGVTTIAVLTSIDRAGVSLSTYAGESALALSEGCAEDALLMVRNDELYDGGDLHRPEGVCHISVDTDGTKRTIEAHTDGVDVRTVRVKADRTSVGVSVDEWREI